MGEILALDADTRRCGWLHGTQREILRCGCLVLETARGRPPWDLRIAAFGRWLDAFLREHEAATVVAYEIAAGDRGNMRTNRLLGACEYEARRVAGDHCRRFLDVNPAQVKATGAHKDARDFVGIFVGQYATKVAQLGYWEAAEPDREHVADAVGVWLAAVKILRGEGEYEQEEV